jgi:hypothetical protein
MSADNGVYILETSGPEFRVTYAQAIDNIYGKFNDSTAQWEGDMNMMVDYFKESEIFDTYEKAFNHAIKLSKEHEYLEDGICFIHRFKNRHFGV